MPRKSGLDVLDELEKQHLGLPVIVIMADESPQIREKARMLKVTGFFHKPIDGPALLDAIKWALETQTESKQTA